VSLRRGPPSESGASGDSAMMWTRRSCPLIDDGHYRKCRTPGCKARMAAMSSPASPIIRRIALTNCCRGNGNSMSKPPRYLKQLEHELLALGDDAMLLEELDGFIAGLVICPDLIKPSEWLPVVWGSEEEDEPAFENLDHLNRVLGLVMEHYNDVARTLIERPDRYGPRFAVDKRHNEILWEIWVAGFERAVKLRPAAWQRLLTADPETAQAMSGLLTLADVDRRDSRFTPEQLDTLTAAAPHQIGPWVVTLNEWRLANYAPTQDFQTPRSSFSMPASKVGRNDPCPCGSGRKHKKCCGLN
jgi:uncharacterized protein